MPNTTNFNWATPADTDLVKDGAAAIRTLGNSIDSSFVDLKGGTSGQILSKASNTDLDFTFITPNVGDITEVQAGTGISVADGTGPIPVVTNTVATTFDAKGDLVVGTGADTFAKLTVGTNGHILVAKSSEATGLAWEAPATGGMTLINTGGTTLTGASVSISSIPATYKNLQLVIRSYKPATDGQSCRIRFNNDTATRYTTEQVGQKDNVAFGDTYINLIRGQDNGTDNSIGILNVFDYANTTTWKISNCLSFANNATTTANFNAEDGFGGYNQTAAINEINIFPASGNFTSGTAYLYGVS